LEIHEKVRKIQKSINDKMIEGKFDEIDEIISKLDLSDLSTFEMVGYLRISSPIKDKLKHWKPFLIEVEKYLDNLGEKSNTILVGLL